MLNIEDPYHPKNIKHYLAQVKMTNTCWNWKGGKRNMYGDFRYGWRDNRHIAAHKYLVINLIPDGLTVDHLCRNTLCVKPSHTRFVTRPINSAGRIVPAGGKRGKIKIK